MGTGGGITQDTEIKLPQGSSSQLRLILSPRRHLAVSGDILLVTMGGSVLASGG